MIAPSQIYFPFLQASMKLDEENSPFKASSPKIADLANLSIEDFNFLIKDLIKNTNIKLYYEPLFFYTYVNGFFYLNIYLLYNNINLKYDKHGMNCEYKYI